MFAQISPPNKKTVPLGKRDERSGGRLYVGADNRGGVKTKLSAKADRGIKTLENTNYSLIYIYEKINIINFYVIPLVRNGMGADCNVGGVH